MGNNIGRRINDVLPNLSTAKELSARQYKVGTQQVVTERELDLDDDGKPDLIESARQTGAGPAVTDTYQVLSGPHRAQMLQIDPAGIVRAEFVADPFTHADGTPADRQQVFRDTNGDGKVDWMSQSEYSNGSAESWRALADTDFDGTFDAEQGGSAKTGFVPTTRAVKEPVPSADETTRAPSVGKK